MLNSISAKTPPSSTGGHDATPSSGQTTTTSKDATGSGASGQAQVSTTSTGSNGILGNMPGEDASVSTPTSQTNSKLTTDSTSTNQNNSTDTFSRNTNTVSTSTTLGTSKTSTNTSGNTSTSNSNGNSNSNTNLNSTPQLTTGGTSGTNNSNSNNGNNSNNSANNSSTVQLNTGGTSTNVNLTGNIPGSNGSDTFSRNTNTSSSIDLSGRADESFSASGSTEEYKAYNNSPVDEETRTALLSNMPGASSEDNTYKPSLDVSSALNEPELPLTNEPTYAPNSELLNFFSTDENTVLFGSENVTQSSNLAFQVAADDTGQSFNASLAALAAQNPESVVGMIKPNGDNTYNVNFYVNATHNATTSESSASQSTPSFASTAQNAPVHGAQNAQVVNVPMRQVMVRVSDAFLPGNLPTDGSGNSIMWAALVNKAYAQLLDSGLMGAQNPNDPLSTMTGRQVTVLNAETPLEAQWRALSLANPPLKVPVTAYSGASNDEHPNIAANRAFNILGTFRDPITNEPMVQMHRPGLDSLDPRSMFSVPLSVYQRAILTTIIADGRPNIDLVNPQDPLSAPTLANCCMMARGGSAQARRQSSSDSLRVFDSPARLKENRCMSCAYARHLCMPS